MNTKRIIGLLTAFCLIVSCFTGVVFVNAEETVLETISADAVSAAILSENADSTITVTATQEEGYIGVAVMSALLKKHKNANDALGYWAGFAVAAPDGATQLKYAFSASEDAALGELTPLEENVTADGKKGIAFYADAGSAEPKKNAKLQWFDADGNALCAETSFVMNFDGITFDGKAIEITELDKKSESVSFDGVNEGDTVSVDFSKIKMEYGRGYDDDEYKTTFTTANIVDAETDPDKKLATLYDEGTYKVKTEAYDYDDHEIKIEMKNLLAHKNGEGKYGFWTGFSVNGPEGAATLSYYKNFGNEPNQWKTVNPAADNSFYLNLGECIYSEYIELQWLDADDNPLSGVEHYRIDTDDVTIAAAGGVTFGEANVADSFPGVNAPEKVYTDYSVTCDDDYEIKIAMTDLLMHRNGEKQPGYWTGFKVNAPQGTKKIEYYKNFGNNKDTTQTVTLEEGATSEDFYFDVESGYSFRYIKLRFIGEDDKPLTRRKTYVINTDDVYIKYPTESAIGKANVKDKDSDDPVYDAYDVDYENDGVIKLSATNLKKHKNGNGTEGHWIGFTVSAPEGVTHYTYSFGSGDNASVVNTPTALTLETDGGDAILLENGTKAIPFYVNASAHNAKDYLEIRWYCAPSDTEAGDVANYPYTYYSDCYEIDLTGVHFKNAAELSVKAANIVNRKNADVSPYEGTPTATLEEDGTTIKLTVDKLKTHFNGDSPQNIGAWVGAAISMPGAAEYIKYVFAEEGCASWYNANFATREAVTDGENFVSFYVDAYDETPKNTIMLQWFDDEKTAITDILTYKLDLTDVKYTVDDEAEITFGKANIVDQSGRYDPAYVGNYDVKVDGDTVKLSADCIRYHGNGASSFGYWVGFKAAVDGAKYLKYVFVNDNYSYDWYDANMLEVDGEESFYVNTGEWNTKNLVMLQWFDENGAALTNVKTYKIDSSDVLTEEIFTVTYSKIELAGANAAAYKVSDKYVDDVSTADYVYVRTAATNGTVKLTVDGTDESCGGNVFYRNADRKVTLTATAAAGYSFGGWFDKYGNKVSGSASYEVALNRCYVLKARFNTVVSGSTGGGSSSSVARPVASVAAGAVEKGTKVTLSTKTDGADIYYTLDNTTPTASSTLYGGAITVNEDTILKAIAIKGKKQSSVLTVKYTIKNGESANNAATFKDIADYAWANEAITFLAKKGIIKGISETEFAPASDIKRADFMLLLVRMLNLKAEVTDNFGDVSEDMYYYEALGIAKALGLTNGMGNNKFNPEASITRQDMFVLAYRVLQMQKAALENADEGAISTFDDFSKIADYAKEALSVLVKNELVKGNDNSINPFGNATRAETAVFIYRLYNLLNK